ncbi:MAG: hypothetical protein ABJF01_02830 [bacterium]
MRSALVRSSIPSGAPAPSRVLTPPAVSVITANPPTNSPAVPIVILGTDAMLAALPATPVQLAHACLRAGFANAIPANWGDELVASAVLRRLPEFGNSPVIQCSCPIVAHRLLTVGGDLRPVLLPVVPPPVAIARYIRALSHPARARITYVGNCPGAIDESIDIRMTPEALIDMLGERDIILAEQPHVFESILPPDRRRFRSQPGGVPTAEALWTEFGSRSLVEIDGDDIVGEIAQHVLTGKNVLIDVSARLGCACSGAVRGTAPKDARPLVVIHEPPRATAAIVDERTPIKLDLEIPAASRTPVDIMALRANADARRSVNAQRGQEMPLGHRATPVHGIATIGDLRPPRNSGGVSLPRSVSVPWSVTPPRSNPTVSSSVVRKSEGKTLPRAFIARRRSPSRGVPLPPPSPGHSASDQRDTSDRSADPPDVSAPRLTLRQLIVVLIVAIGVTIGVRAVVRIAGEQSIAASLISESSDR